MAPAAATTFPDLANDVVTVPEPGTLVPLTTGTWTRSGPCRAPLCQRLHTLQTGEVSRTGGCEIIRVDVRVIASTVHGGESSDHLSQELKRLNAVEICIPPIRQRTEVIPVEASFFLERCDRRYRRDVLLCPDVIARFKTHAWQCVITSPISSPGGRREELPRAAVMFCREQGLCAAHAHLPAAALAAARAR